MCYTGQLRGEKVGLMAQVRKQQARIQHLKQTVTDLGKQVQCTMVIFMHRSVDSSYGWVEGVLEEW